jgi:predicted small metal-binding protein
MPASINLPAFHWGRLRWETPSEIAEKEEQEVAYTLACRDAGVDCPHVAQGDTEEEALQAGLQHVKAAHGFTDEQLSDPTFIEESRKLIKSS